jgi:hypothetical protein
MQLDFKDPSITPARVALIAAVGPPDCPTIALYFINPSFLSFLPNILE